MSNPTTPTLAPLSFYYTSFQAFCSYSFWNELNGGPQKEMSTSQDL